MENWTVSWALFDLNGTLLDPSAIADPLGGTEEDRRLVAEAFEEALLLTMADTISGGPYRPLPEYLGATLERALRAAGRDASVLDEAMQRAAVMDPFPDARVAIATLRDGGIRTGVLTNSTTQAAEGALAAAGLRDLLDVLIGGDAVQAFKPHPRVYEHAASQLGAKGADICLIAAHAWDVMGAMRAGLRGALGRTDRALARAGHSRPGHPRRGPRARRASVGGSSYDSTGGSMSIELAERTAEVDGARHRWLEGGEGPPVVLVHGIPTSPALWRHVVAELDGMRVLAWEMLGYGMSHQEGGSRDISVKAQAGYLRRWLAHLGIRRAVLVGHDLGGGVVQIAAVSEPPLCGGLVLTNAIAYDSWPIPSVKAMRALGPLVARTPTTLFLRILDTFVSQGHDDARRARESAQAHRPAYDHAHGAAAFVRQIRSLRTADTLEVAALLPQLSVPAAIVWGAADRFQKVSHGGRLARDLRAHLETVAAGKHFMPEDHPREIAAAIGRTVERGA